MGFLIPAILVLGLVPGALLFRLPIGDRARRAAVPADERFFWSILLSVTWSVALAMLLAALRLYSLGRVVWITAGLAVAVIAIGRGRLRYPAPAARVTWTALLPLGIVALGAGLYFPTSEYVIGGKDPGTYVNEGIQLARQGSIVIDDADVAAIPPELRDLFFEPDPYAPGQQGVRFMGFVIADAGEGRVIGQFPHWFPASIALGYDLAGVPGALNVVAVWALLGLATVYFAGVHLFGRVAATLGTALLAINVVMVWFGRYPNTEVASQAMLFGAVLAFGRALDTDRRFFGPIAGALLSLQLLLRFDTVLAIGAFTAAAVLMRVVRQRIGWGFVSMAAVLGAIGLWYLMVPMQAYTWWYTGFIRVEAGWALIAAALGAAIFVWLMRHDRLANMARGSIPIAIAAVLAALAIYAYFFREPAGRLALHDAHSLRHFAWYVTPIGLLLAVAGLVVMLTQRFWRNPAFFMLVAVYGVFFFYKIRITNEHFWATRRVLAVVLPAALLLIAALVSWLSSPETWPSLRERLRSSRLVTAAIGSGLALALVAPFGVAYWRQSRPLLPHREYAGVQAKIDRLSAQVGPRDLLLAESRDAGSDVHVLALPLAYQHGRHVLVLHSDLPDKAQLEAFVDWAQSRYDHVYFLGGGGTDLITRQFDAIPVGADQFSVPEYDSPRNRYPSGIRQKQFEFGLYRLERAQARAPGPVDLTIGVLDDLNVVNFFARERRPSDGLVYRWSKNRAHVILPAIAANVRELTIWMGSGGRPSKVAPAEVAVSIHGQSIGSAMLVDEIRPYRFTLPRELVEPLAARRDPIRVTIDVPTWNPMTVLGTPDSRDLGVMVSRLEVR